MTMRDQNCTLWTGKQRDLSYTIYDDSGKLADLTGVTYSFTLKHNGGIITIVPTVDVATSKVDVSILSSHTSLISAGQEVSMQLLPTKGGVPYPPSAIGNAPVYQSDG